MELVTLHAYQCNKVLYIAAAWFLQQLKVAEIRLDVFINGMHFNRYASHLAGREAGDVVNSTIGHEAFPESLHQTFWVVLGWLNNHDSKFRWLGHDFPYPNSYIVRLGIRGNCIVSRLASAAKLLGSVLD